MNFNYISHILIGTSFILVAQPARAQLPPSTQLLNQNTVDTVGGYNDPQDSIDKIAIADTAVPFREALQVKRVRSSANTYDAAMIWPTTGAVRRNDLLVATFYIRKAANSPAPLTAVEASFQLSDAPFTLTLQSNTSVDTTIWQRFTVPFYATVDLPSGATSFQLRYGARGQNFDVGGISVANYGQLSGVFPAALQSSFAFYYPGRADPKAPWRLAALENIEKFRKGNMTLRVVNPAGTAIPATQVRVEQVRSRFAWGSAAEARFLVCDTALPSGPPSCAFYDDENTPFPADDIRRYRAAVIDNFEYASFFNDLKWPEWEARSGQTIRAIDWMQRNGVTPWRSHTLIWPGFEPEFKLPDDIRPGVPAETVRRRVLEHIADEVGTLAGRIREWDVINEPYTNFDIQGRVASPGVTASNGVLPPAVVADWFKAARAADPKALLFLNDFSIFENYNETGQKYDLALLKDIQARGAPVDGIGLQAHFSQSGPIFTDMARTIADFSPLVKTFSVTEFDFLTIDPKLQGDLMNDFMTFIFGQPKFNTFQMWGFWDGDKQQGNEPLFTRDWQLKPSGKVWQDLTKRIWRTNTTATTNASGTASVRAFYGRYRFTYTVNSKQCTATREFEPAGFATTTVTLPAC
jgi:GH35 family endo-1,4-beta-xylanase